MSRLITIVAMLARRSRRNQPAASWCGVALIMLAAGAVVTACTLYWLAIGLVVFKAW